MSEGEIIYNDTIVLKVSSREEGETVTALEIATVGGSTFELIIDGAQAKIPTSALGGGNKRLRISADLSSGEKATRYKELKIVAKKPPQEWSLLVVNKYPHTANAFTEGFLMHDGFLYEGTGNYNESRLIKSELKTGKIIQEKAVAGDVFGEGITILNGKLYQLSYKSGRGFVYNANTFERLREFTFAFATNEGWGLTHSDTELIAGDGSNVLYFIDPKELTVSRTLSVFDHTGSVEGINELEYRDGTIYANIYTTATIIAIDAATGKVTDRYAARGLVEQSDITSNMDVLNGIAINPENGNLLITGKYWSKIYEVRPIPGGG